MSKTLDKLKGFWYNIPDGTNENVFILNFYETVYIIFLLEKVKKSWYNKLYNLSSKTEQSMKKL